MRARFPCVYVQYVRSDPASLGRVARFEPGKTRRVVFQQIVSNKVTRLLTFALASLPNAEILAQRLYVVPAEITALPAFDDKKNVCELRKFAIFAVDTHN